MGGNVRDAVDVVIRNFGEMNRLWIRMQVCLLLIFAWSDERLMACFTTPLNAQNAGSVAKGRKRRERERQDLRILVSAPLTRLSTLSGIDAAFYASDVLPRLVAEISSCKDDLAQQHLFDSLVQVCYCGVSLRSHLPFTCERPRVPAGFPC